MSPHPLIQASALLLLAIPTSCGTEAAQKSGGSTPPREQTVATYSIVGFDPKTGDLGVAVQSKFFGVGTVVPWAKAGVGAVATQADANITYGSEGLKLLAQGKSPDAVIKKLTEKDDRRESRQCGIVDARGRSAVFTGRNCTAFASQRAAKNIAIQGNILEGPGVLDAMMSAFAKARETPGSELADWLLAALQAGEDAGGDRRGRQSAALLVVRDKAGYGGANDRYIDLRVDDDANPTLELSRLLALHKDFYADKHAAKPRRKPDRRALPRGRASVWWPRWASSPLMRRGPRVISGGSSGASVAGGANIPPPPG